MALFKCEHCGQPISDKAPFCPKCGYLRVKAVSEKNLKPQGSAVPPTSNAPLKTPKGLWAMGIIGLLILAGGIVWLVQGIHNHNEQYLAELEFQRLERLRIEEQQRLEAILLQEEQERLDSIRQDSIALEEKMRIDPMIFARDGYRKKLLKQYGFKVVYDRKFINYDIDDGFEDYEIRYTRTVNGRKIVFDEWGTTCMGASLTFYDPIDKKNFIEDIKKAGYKKEDGNFYSRENPWHQITFEGNTAYVVHCG